MYRQPNSLHNTRNNHKRQRETADYLKAAPPFGARAAPLRGIDERAGRGRGGGGWAGGRGRKQDIAATVALTRDLFRMRSVPAVTVVLAALGVALSQPSLQADNFNFSLLKQFEFGAPELKAGGFDAS